MFCNCKYFLTECLQLFLVIKSGPVIFGYPRSQFNTLIRTCNETTTLCYVNQIDVKRVNSVGREENIHKRLKRITKRRQKGESLLAYC